MTLRNCWEVKKCGREPGGANAAQLGVCAAATDRDSDGLNGGHNGGRTCWAVAGTLCGGKIQGTFAQKELTCLACDFYKDVKAQTPSDHFVFLRNGQHFTGRHQ